MKGNLVNQHQAVSKQKRFNSNPELLDLTLFAVFPASE